MKDIAVIGGTSASFNSPSIKAAAIEVGLRLSAEQHSILTCGNKHGVIGLLLGALKNSEERCSAVVLRGQEELSVHPAAGTVVLVDSIAERKEFFASNARVIVALPGGLGTHDEIFSFLMEMGELKRIFMVNVAGYFDPLLLQMSNMVGAGLLKSKVLRSVDAYSDVVEAMDACNELLEKARLNS